jgi:hypothetical protein
MKERENSMKNSSCHRNHGLPPKAGVLAGAPNAGVLLPPKLKPPLLAGWLAVAPNKPPAAGA